MVSVITEEGSHFCKNSFPIYPQVTFLETEARKKKERERENNSTITYELFIRNPNFILPEIHLPLKLKSNFIPTGAWPHEIPKFISSREIPFHILTHTETIKHKTQERGGGGITLREKSTFLHKKKETFSGRGI